MMVQDVRSQQGVQVIQECEIAREKGGRVAKICKQRERNEQRLAMSMSECQR